MTGHLLGTKSLAESLASLRPYEQRRALRRLTEAEAAALETDWRFWARPKQLPPPGNWSTWVILAGRGFGKTAAGRGWTHEEAMRSGCHIALVARNPADFRDYMWDGPGGFRRNCPPAEMPVHTPSLRRVTWPNGSIGTVYSGEDPEAIRGFSGSRFWIDEFAKFRYPKELWDNLQFGMREVSHDRPRGVITTTPRPSPILTHILKLPGTVKVVGTSYENRNNLDPAYFETTIKAYEGTRLGRQEIRAEILDDVQGALWTRAMIDKARAPPAKIPDMQRIVVAIDPSGARGADDENADSIGIVVAGRGVDGRGYILADRSCKLSPAGWARRALLAYDGFNADRIIAERNFGGAMVESTIKLVAEAMEPPMIVSYSEVVASRGKVQRAEPVAALYEQGRVSHVASDTDELVELEDQLCQMTTSGYLGEGSPDRVDADVWALTELMLPKSTYDTSLSWVGG